jgi:C4-dicarboxylate-specific signal transduction histidine kinase
VKGTDAERLLTMGLAGLGIAHELNTPLSTTGLALELLAERLRGPSPPAPAEVAAELDRVLVTVRRMGELVRRLRALARGRGGEPEQVALDEVVDAAVQLARPTLAELSEIRVKRGDRQPDAVVRADRLLLEQALLCILLNALDALQGRGTVTVSVRCGPTAPAVEVRDDGPGFAEAGEASAAGYTTKGAGMGVGLALADLIAREAGATLTADNHPDGGARVTIEFGSP